MQQTFNYCDEKFADIQILRYRMKGFEQMSLNKKMYIYCLAKATLCGRDITTDQFGKYNLRIRRLLEAVSVLYISADTIHLLQESVHSLAAGAGLWQENDILMM